MKVYYVEYRPCPTAHNAPVHLTLSLHGLLDFVEFSSGGCDKVVLTDKARRLGHSFSQGTQVQRIYEETDSEKLVHYQHRGYGEPHVSAWLSTALNVKKPEVLA